LSILYHTTIWFSCYPSNSFWYNGTYFSLCVYDLYRVPKHFVSNYAQGVTIGTTAVYEVLTSYNYLCIHLSIGTLVEAPPWHPANHHMQIRFGRRHGDGSCICGGIVRQIGIVDIISRWKEICVPILLHVSFDLILVTKLWDMIMCLCMRKGQTHHLKVLESKSGCKTAKTFDFGLQVTLKWESNSWIRDEIDK